MDLQPQVESIVAKLRGAVETLTAAWDAGGAGPDPGDLERRCRAVGLALAHELLACSGRAMHGGSGPSRPLPVRRHAAPRRPPLPGPARPSEPHPHRRATYYFCRTCGQGWLPLDETLGLPRVAATPALFEAAVTCGSVAPPEEAADLLGRLAGVTLSPKSVERYTKAAGQAVEHAVEARAQRAQGQDTPEPPPGPPAKPAQPYNLQFDGSLLRMRTGGFREVKVGCLFDARDLAEVRAGRREVLRKHHEVHLGGPEPVGDRMYAAARAAGVTADGSNAISQGDGAPWVWNLVQLHWPAAREVLDFYHLSEHLHACGQAVWGLGSARAREWARTIGEQTLHGHAGVLRHALGRLRPTTPASQQAVAAPSLRSDPCRPPGLRGLAGRGLCRC
jgi:hypothetical protein